MKNFSKEKKNLEVLSDRVHLTNTDKLDYSWNTGINTPYHRIMNYDHHSKKTLFIEYFQIDFHVQQRKKLAADYLSIQGL